MLRSLLTLSFFVLLTIGAQAQEIEKCATMQMDSLLRARYPELGTLNDFERQLQQKIIQIKKQMANGREAAATVITIPIVVHVVHNGEAVGVGRNISQAQVQSQLATLNEDFRRRVGTRGFNANPVGADIEIEFCLATVNQQGQTMAEPGIDRYNGGRANWTRDDIEGVLKPSTYWNPDKYYNVWVLDLAGVTANRILLGYAQFPSSSNLAGIPFEGPASTDGVVVYYRAFGNAEKGSFPTLLANANLGRTLTHETGHWLGLRHIWGDDNCGDDFCADTPPQATYSEGCPVGRVSCGNVNMVQNYMDYTDDYCVNVFTLNQKDRIRAVMDISPRRATLLSSNVCGNQVATRPVSNFRANNQQVLLGGQVRFNDLSNGFPTAWTWTFEGGTPSTSTEQNPTVTYNQPGVYSVTLVTSNALGTSEPTVQVGIIQVLNQGLCSTLTNFNGTPTVLRETNGTGYVAGQNSRRSQAISEFFANRLSYQNLSGASLRFGVAKAARGAATESVVTVTVWNGRGFQGGPGAILTQKDVPLRVILEDVANNRPTNVTFDRNAPVGGLPFHVGITLPYATGDTVALVTTRNGESLNATSWRQNQRGDWLRYADSLGVNVAHNIIAQVGQKASVQVAASSLFINSGQTVTLNARGASIFSWTGTGLNTTLGAQVVAAPTQTTSYTVTGSGLDLCNATAVITINVRTGSVVTGTTPLAEQALQVTPNPSDGQMTVSFSNPLRGALTLGLRNLNGVEILRQNYQKTTDLFQQTLDVKTAPSGVYFVEVRIGENVFRKRIVKQ